MKSSLQVPTFSMNANRIHSTIPMNMNELGESEKFLAFLVPLLSRPQLLSQTEHQAPKRVTLCNTVIRHSNGVQLQIKQTARH